MICTQTVMALAEPNVAGQEAQETARVAAIAETIPPAPAINEPPMTDIHDIKPPQRYGMNPSLVKYAAYAVIASMLIALLIFFIRFVTRRRQPATESVVTLPPDELAFRRLSRFNDIGRWDGKDFYFELSQVFRGYMQQRFGIEALEMTTEEFLPQVRGLQLETELFNGVKELFHYSDPVKFAAIPADHVKMETDLKFVRMFVNKTRPAPETKTETAETT